MKTDIESLSLVVKIIRFFYKDYKVSIFKNGRGDCSLSIVKFQNLKSYEKPDMIIGNNVFLTIKSAKRKAIEIVDFFS